MVGLVSLLMLLSVAAQLPALEVSADTSPADPTDPRTPATVALDALPTVQVDGVVWAQAVIGNTVYAVGSFTTARPAGAAAGVNTVARSNALAYNLTTGVLNTTWAPSLNGQGMAVAASPDGSRIYIGGDFTEVNGETQEPDRRRERDHRRPDQQLPAASPTPESARWPSPTTRCTSGGFSRRSPATPGRRVAAVRASDGGSAALGAGHPGRQRVRARPLA